MPRQPRPKEPTEKERIAALEERIRRNEQEKASLTVPLDKAVTLRLTRNKQLESIPDIDPTWLAAPLRMLPLPPLDDSRALSALLYAAEDLSQLLAATHRLFWCHLLHDPSVLPFLDSTLRHAPRPHEFPALRDDVGEALDRVLGLVLKVFVRATTNPEADGHFLSRDNFPVILYDNWLLDVPKIMDLCVLYAPTNYAMVRRVVVAAFRAQPQYLKDLASAAGMTATVLDELVGQAPTIATPAVASQVASYAADIADSVGALLAVAPEYSAAVLDQSGLLSLLALVYAELLPQLRSLLGDNTPVTRRLHTALVADVDSLLRVHYFASMELSLDNVGVRIQAGAGAAQSAHDLAQNLLAAMTAWPPGLIRDLQDRFDLARRLWELLLLGTKADRETLEYMVSIVAQVCDQPALATPPVDLQAEDTATDPASGTDAGADGDNDDAAHASLVAQLKDMFPDYSDGFLAVCLETYNWNAETTLHNLLEDSLPAELSKLDRKQHKFQVHRGKRRDKKKMSESESREQASIIRELALRQQEEEAAELERLQSEHHHQQPTQSLHSPMQAARALADLYDDEPDDSWDAFEEDVKGVDAAAASEVDDRAEAGEQQGGQTKQQQQQQGKGKGKADEPISRRRQQFKNKNKAAIGNHHRKERAVKKMQKAM